MFTTREAHALYRLDVWAHQRDDPQDDWRVWHRAWWEKRAPRWGTPDYERGVAYREKRRAQLDALAAVQAARLLDKQQHLARYIRWCRGEEPGVTAMKPWRAL